MEKIKRGIALFTIMSLFFIVSLVPSTALSKQAGIAIDGSSISIPATYGMVYIDSANRIQAPIRFVSENLGATITWNQNTKTATIDGDIQIKVGSNKISTAYGTITMDTTAVIIGNRVYVPIRYIGNALGYKIDATSKNGIVTANVVTKAELTISAASSLKDAMNEVKALYLKEKPNTALTINLGASGALEQQIEQGAPVDLFFSASSSSMTLLKDKNLLDNTTLKNMLGNKVVLIVPKDSKVAITSFSDVLDASIKKIALGEPTTVPAGQYAEQVFTYLKILNQVKAKAVYGKDVKEVLTWVETGNVDAGVVYSTDAKVSTKVAVIATASDASHKAIIYPAAVIKSTKNSEAAKDFMNFLSSDSVKAIFLKYGFSVL
ncbi:MAG: molybdate ABC transporter substrate-binding protein [Eubacteriales bacterium]